jgi:hypothetical protein
MAAEGDYVELASGTSENGTVWAISGTSYHYGTQEVLCRMLETQSATAPANYQALEFCEPRPARHRLGSIVAVRRCDKDTAFVTGYAGAGLARIKLRRRDGSLVATQADTLRIDGHVAHGFRRVMSSREAIRSSLVGFDTHGRQRVARAVRYESIECF